VSGVLVVIAFYVGPFLPWPRIRRLAAGAWGRLRRRPPPGPAGRPLEVIAQDARRLGTAFRNQPRGCSFAKYEGRRRAYEGVLAEACRTLGVVHLLDVLPPGQERDAERSRVEYALECAGLELAIPF
jgi:hypothetical protein